MWGRIDNCRPHHATLLVLAHRSTAVRNAVPVIPDRRRDRITQMDGQNEITCLIGAWTRGGADSMPNNSVPVIANTIIAGELARLVLHRTSVAHPRSRHRQYEELVTTPCQSLDGRASFSSTIDKYCLLRDTVYSRLPRIQQRF
jgi:hypothetical protein